MVDRVVVPKQDPEAYSVDVSKFFVTKEKK